MNKGVLIGVLASLVVSCNKPDEETPRRGLLFVVAPEPYAVLLQEEAREYERSYPEAVVSVSARTTREAIVALLNDSLHLICTDRPLNDEELSVVKKAGLPLTETKIAEDALAIVVHRTNPIKEISMASLEAIFLGTKQSWSDIPEARWSGSIDVVLTDRNSGSYELLSKTFLKTTGPLAATHAAQSEKEILQYIALHQRAVGVVSSTVLRDSIPSIKALAVQSTNPESPSPFVKLHQANIYRGFYPLHYPIFLYSTAKQGKAAFWFSVFVASAPGQKILLNAGLVPATMPVRLVQINQE